MSKKYVKELIEMSDSDLEDEFRNMSACHFRNMISLAMKEQDRDTRHACAEAVSRHGDTSALEMIDKCFNSCMNVRAL